MADANPVNLSPQEPAPAPEVAPEVAPAVDHPVAPKGARVTVLPLGGWRIDF